MMRKSTNLIWPTGGELLYKLLVDDGWQVIERNVEHKTYDVAEVWRIRSVAQNWGLELFVTFHTDPMGGGAYGVFKKSRKYRRRGSSAWEIIASLDIPGRYSDEDESEVAWAMLSPGKHKSNITEFVAQLAKYRDNRESG